MSTAACSTPSPIFGLSVRAVIRNEQAGTVLLLRRPPGEGIFAGLWEFPGGKTDPGESFDAALRREIREETGLEPVLGRVVGQAQGEVRDISVVYLFMECHVPGAGQAAPAVKLSKEHTDFKWVTIDELAKVASGKGGPPDEMKLVEHFRAFAAEYARRHGYTTAAPSKTKSNLPSPGFVAMHVEAYKKVQPLYVNLGECLRETLKPVLKAICPLGEVQFRAKSVSSVAGKILRKGHYTDPMNEMTDLCGVRIIVQIPREVDEVCRYIRANFVIDERNSEDKLSRLRTREFGYRSVHYIVQFDGRKFPHISSDLLPLKAEIQVRTILQHAWADIGHDRLYKAAFPTPAIYERESARIAALLEDADGAFQRLVDGLENYECHYGAYLTGEQKDERIALQRAILHQDPDNGAERLRLVRLLQAKGDWKDAADEVLSRPEDERSPDLWCSLGDSLRHLNETGAAREAYDKALKIERSHREALIGRAETETDAVAKLKCYDEAFQQHSHDPTALSGYVRQKIKVDNSAAFVPLLRASLEAAIERCQLQVQVGVDLPWSFFRIAGFRLLLGGDHVQGAFDALARAIHCSEGQQALVETAFEAAAELHKADPNRREAEAARRFLLAGILARFPESALAATARSMATEGAPAIATPVVIVAGGCDTGSSALLSGFRELLGEAFAGFEGTVISGGTKEGVAGMVGELGAASQTRIHTLGYHSEKLPADGSANVDGRYCELRRVAGTEGFSELEPLQNWLDLLASDIKPQHVCVLGINGGRIAAFEYRLAWALGARVAVLEDSGREAGKLEAAIRAGDYPGILPLPRDAMTLRSFLLGDTPWPASLPVDAEERLARLVHAEFLEENRHKHSDVAMQPWETLRDDLRGSNLSQVRFMIQNLRAHGFEVRPFGIDTPEFRFDATDKADLEAMAMAEHGRWNIERLREGWRYGPVRDPENKRSPYLVSWDRLDEGTKKWDLDSVVKKYPARLKEAGLNIVRV